MRCHGTWSVAQVSSSCPDRKTSRPDTTTTVPQGTYTAFRLGSCRRPGTSPKDPTTVARGVSPSTVRLVPVIGRGRRSVGFPPEQQSGDVRKGQGGTGQGG